MRRAPTPGAATILAALAIVTTSGCAGDEPKQPSQARRDAAVAHCAGYECKVTARCKGHVYRRYGPAPVRIHTKRTALRTTIVADFAGSRNDAVIRC